MRRDVAGWLAFWASAGCLFYVAEQRGWPLCGAARHLFRTHTTPGRNALAGGLGAGAGILIAHLVKPITSDPQT